MDGSPAGAFAAFVSFTRTTTSFVEIKVTDGLPPIVMQVTTKHPWLDWTARMARQSTEYTKETLQAYELRSDGSLQPKSDAGRNAVVSIEDDRADIRPSAAPR